MEVRKRLISMVVLIATIILVFQSLPFPSGSVFSSMLPAFRLQDFVKKGFESENSTYKHPNPQNSSVASEAFVTPEASHAGVAAEKLIGKEHFVLHDDQDSDDDSSLSEDGELDNQFLVDNVVDSEKDLKLENFSDPTNNITLQKARESEKAFVEENEQKRGGPLANVSYVSGKVRGTFGDNATVHETSVVFNVSSMAKQEVRTIVNAESFGQQKNVSAASRENSIVAAMPEVVKGRRPTTIHEMNQLLLRSRVSSRLMKPQWSSACDQELLSAKMLIENAPIVKSKHELYGPVFQNVSLFKRSYELMEHKLKVYIYKEGEKPIFHEPHLSGIYSSEGWFMNLIEGNKQFVTQDPKKAHLFYLPFCSYTLRTVLVTPSHHNKPQITEFLNNYVRTIATKYPFWNRSGGTDHFLVACHDWAPYATRKDLVHSLRALCNADVSRGFKLGKDTSLPVTNIHSANPLKALGGQPAYKRQTLAFFAGNVHGRLRAYLLKYWENKDPDMKIFGPLPRKPDGAKTYIQYMKSSKYCICPRGYEVHSPRVVEAIYYECVPVIISDNYVPPFFEVLNWEAFAVFIAEKDIPMLKDILLSISEKRYRAMQLRVKNVQKHFIWHDRPVRYDVFHMILHSVWFNRLNQIRTR